MKLDNEFTVGVPIEEAWAVLTDLELIAPCMPGAQLTGVTDGVYTGKVKIKVGPVTAEYAGTAQFTEKDESEYRAVIDARGRDSRGQGHANAVISAQLRASGTSTVVTVNTDLSIAGRIAQFGSGMIKEVSAKLLGQFVQCLEEKLGSGAQGAKPDGPAEPAGIADGLAGADDTGGVSEASAPAPAAPAAAAPAAAAPAAAAPAAAAAATARTGGIGPGEPAPLDLMSLAGRSIYKRVVPLAVAVVVVVVIIVLIVH